MNRIYLTSEEVQQIHYVLIERYGGSHGLRDAGALEAALYRPQTGYYEDLIWESAALLESLVNNHPFVDGNKRIGIAVADVFLDVNGWLMTQSSAEIFHNMMRLFEARAFSVEHIEPWLRSMTVQHPPATD